MKLKSHYTISTLLLVLLSLILSGCTDPETDQQITQPSPKLSLILDTFNNNSCSHTNSTLFTLNTTTNITYIKIWYHWSNYETNFSYTIYVNNATEIKNGTFKREENCEPVESEWCIATTSINQTFLPGTYQLLIPNNQMGMNSESNYEGFIKLYGIKD